MDSKWKKKSDLKLKDSKTKKKPVEITNQYEYLELVFRSDGKMKFSAAQMSYRAKKVYYAIKSNFSCKVTFFCCDNS